MNPPSSSNLERCLADHGAGRDVASGTPDVLTIESTAICNLRCVMCPQSVGRVKRPKHMSGGLEEKLAPFIAGAGHIQLHGIGEPTASNAFWRLLDMLPQGPIGDVNSNFTILNDARLEGLAHSRLETIHVSLDAARSGTYRRIRGFDLDTVLRNIRRFLERRNAAGRATPRLLMNMTLMRANIEEVVEFVELAHRLGADGVEMWQLNFLGDAEASIYRHERDGWTFDYRAQMLDRHAELSNTWLRKADARARELGIPLILPAADRAVILNQAATPVAASGADAPAGARRTTRDCRNPWRWMLVTSNGDVRPCCYAPGRVANIERDSAESAWNGAPMRRLRRALLQSRVPSACRGAACEYVKNTPLPPLARFVDRAYTRLGIGLWRVAPRFYHWLRGIKRRWVV
jgi:MoaA/NifB/PqqE/SkfB family radical SAM enzyme